MRQIACYNSEKCGPVVHLATNSNTLIHSCDHKCDCGKLSISLSLTICLSVFQQGRPANLQKAYNDEVLPEVKCNIE